MFAGSNAGFLSLSMAQYDFDVVIIGAGISGISAAYYLKERCPDKTFTILDGRDSIGGTWDLFKYPGIRSDSDMYTLGFAFKPWRNPKAIADGPSIMQYLQETIDEFGFREHIQLNSKVTKASWSSEGSQWNLSIANKEGGSRPITCQFIFSCTGYYNYEKGFTPSYKGLDKFKGEFIHPQQWPEKLDYTDKKIIVIGSGATAITLVPELAKTAENVIMLQRSPSYISVMPAKDKIANFLNKTLPDKTAYKINRWRKIRIGNFFYKISRKYPDFIAGLIKKGVKKELGDSYDLDKHFTPKYNPWDQRMCLAPDSDFFEALNSNKAKVVTDQIANFTNNGILLESGEELHADIIVSATGLELQFFGGIDMSVDGEVVDFSKLIVYRGTMFSGVPNICLAFGYTNASWTLKCDLSNEYFSRLIEFMDKKGFASVTPTNNDEDLEVEPFIDFNSSYILRYIDDLPKQGTFEPWKLKQDYYVDLKKLKYDKLEDGVLVFKSTKVNDMVHEIV